MAGAFHEGLGSSAMPHFGQTPGFSDSTPGHIGQTYSASPDAGRDAGAIGAADAAWQQSCAAGGSAAGGAGEAAGASPWQQPPPPPPGWVDGVMRSF